MPESSSVPKLTAIVLAAGKGTRMNSPLPKVLHPVAGIPMIVRVVDVLKKIPVSEIRLVVSPEDRLIRPMVEPMGVQCFVQQQQRGTADAVRSAGLDRLEGDVLITNGDHPLMVTENLKRYHENFRAGKLDIGLVTVQLKNPASYGRVIRHMGTVRAIVEAKDASRETLKITETNTNIYFIRSQILKEYLPKIQSLNVQKEFYITDLVSLVADSPGLKVQGLIGTASDILGVNTQAELARATRRAYRRKAEQLMTAGVMMIDPRHTYVEDSVSVQAGSVIYPNVFLIGNTEIGKFCVIEPNCLIKNSLVGESAQIRMGCHLDSAAVGPQCVVGPYARLRPDTEMAEQSQVGNFVELKKTKLGKRAKANHLTYLGDSEIGEDSNIGAGTITCNYSADKKKYPTKIGDRVFVGSGTQFIAPVEVENDAVIAAGSTITKAVPAGALGIARVEQTNKENYRKKDS